MIKFEAVSKYKDANLPLPTRGTKDSAGYDFVVAEDTVIYPMKDCMDSLDNMLNNAIYFAVGNRMPENTTPATNMLINKMRKEEEIFTLDEVATITKSTKLKPTLVPTGMKCYLEPGTYLELSVRSSTPLKHWLILANGVGIIDADYADNQDNEGHIFFQLINLSPFPILLKKGDKIGQGIIKKYLTTDDDAAIAERTGGFGSTG